MLSDYWRYRLLEWFPGGLAWLTLLACLLLTWLNPIAMVYIIIIYDFYWMVKVVYLSTYLLSAYYRYRRVMHTDWHERCSRLADYHNTYQLVFVPISSESQSVVESTLASLVATNYPKERIIVVLAAEQRIPASVNIATQLAKLYKDTFCVCVATIHPADLPGEIPAKGANLAWAGEWINEHELIPRQLNPDRVVVTTLDADTCLERSYFHYLTYTYLTHPNPTHSSYQPIPMFNNNIWDAPAIMRVASTGTTFWLMSEQVRPERLFTFSSHSMPLRALLDVGWWQRDIVSDDSRIFLQCFLEYDGDYAVTPLYMPVYMDTVLSDTWWKSLVNLYKQQRRWAWGSENIPYMMWHFWGAKQIPLRKRWWHLFNQIEGMWSWSTSSLIIFIFGYLPLWVIPADASATVLAQSAPLVLSRFLTVANIGLILSIILGTLILPKKPKHHRWSRYLAMLLQWALLPISMIVFGTLPSLEAQSRLMLGKYLGFYITEKSRKHDVT